MQGFWIEKWINGIDKKWLKIWISIFIIACLTHTFVLTNQLPNYDSQWFLYSSQDVVTSGRWFLKFAGGISSYFHLQWLNGILAVIYISIAAVVIIRCLEINSVFLSVLAGAIVVVYPSVTKTFNFMYAADAYFMAMLLAAIAAWMMTKDKWYYRIGGGVLLGVSVGIYQAYLSVTLLVLLLWIFKHAVMKKEVVGKFILGMAVGLMTAACVYIIGLWYRLKGGELSSYQGIADSTLFHPFVWYLKRFANAFIDIGKNFITDTYDNRYILFIVGIIWLFTGLFILYRIICLLKTGYGMCALYGTFALLLLPISVYSMNLLSDGVYYYSLMLESAALLWILPLLVLDGREDILHGGGKWREVIYNLIVVCFIINIWSYMVVDNISYLASHISYEKSYAIAERIIDRIEQTEGYKDMEYLYVHGNVSQEKYDDVRFDNKSVIGNGIIPYETKTYTFFINIYLGGSYTMLSDMERSGTEKIDEIQNLIEFQSMPVWPEAGCVKLIDHVMVVKLGE